MISKVVFGGSRSKAVGIDVGLLVLRLWVGLPMALVWGPSKIPPAPGFVEAVGKLGFPMPTFFAWCAGMSEVMGGALLVMGLMTRPAALFLGFTMFVAAFWQKAGMEFFSADRLNPTHFLVMCIVLLITGAGRMSADQALRPKAEIGMGGR